MSLLQFALAVGTRVRRTPATLWRDSQGTAAIEYAFVGLPFMALLTGILYIALANVAQGGLETAAESAARLIVTGQAQSGTVTDSSNNTHTGLTQADFKSAICDGTTITNADGTTSTVGKMLPPFLACNHLSVTIAPASQYNPDGTLVSTYVPTTVVGEGSQNQVMLVQLSYDWPTFSGLMGLNLANENNGYRRMLATSLFTVETYSCAAGHATC